MKEEIKIKKKTLVIFSIATALVLAFIVLYTFKPSVSIQEQTSDLKDLDLETKFAYLSKANTNFCAGVDILQKTNAERLQGSCCSAMDFHRYQEQIEGLKKFSNIKQIPSDPYDIPKVLAEELLDYQKTIQLTSEQQAIYDEAVGLSMEGGTCCCKCWRWYAFEGLAKYLIIEHGFDSEQVAEVWNLEDGCGGSGHVEGIGH